jgi:anaerobic magnesium-protoporphyrin IX monomethyl ester cyclase
MPPVFDSPFAKSDEAYQVFLEGLKALAQAMSKRPYFGDRMLPTNLEKYGTFWSEPHV